MSSVQRRERRLCGSCSGSLELLVRHRRLPANRRDLGDVSVVGHEPVVRRGGQPCCWRQEDDGTGARDEVGGGERIGERLSVGQEGAVDGRIAGRLVTYGDEVCDLRGGLVAIVPGDALEVVPSELVANLGG